MSAKISLGLNNASFDSDYRNLMEDSVTYEISEIYELFHVVAALTPYGKGNTEIIDKTIEYYQEVINQNYRSKADCVSKLRGPSYLQTNIAQSQRTYF